MKTEQLLHIELEFREGSSDKVYRAGIEEADGGFVVNFAFGRRGTTLNTGTKTARPVPYGEAAGIYEKLVRSKTAKGYKPVGGAQTGAGIGTSVTEREQRDTGLRAQLLNPITEDEAEAYLGNDNWCAQEKFDGKRMMLRKSGAEIVAANRDGLCIGFPNAIAEQLAEIDRDFVLDGEVVGETFYAFDLLEIGATDLRPTPYRKRLRVLLTQFGKLCGNVFVAETTAEARRIARSNSMGRCIQYILDLTRRGPGVGMWKRNANQADDSCNLDYFLDEALVVGDPPEVTRQLRELRERIGEFGTLVLVAHDWDDRSRWLRSLELFTREVRPALDREESP